MVTVVIVSNRRHTRWRQWLLIAALAAGLIGMHHLAGDPSSAHATTHTHTHTGTLPVVAEASAGCASPRAGPQSPSTVRDGVSVLSAANSPGGCSCMAAMIGHQCLAVLAAAALLPVMWVLALDADQRGTGGLSTSRPAARVARDAPTSAVRLSQLGILRR